MSQQLLNRLPTISVEISLVPGEWILIWLTLKFVSSITIRSKSPSGQHLISLQGTESLSLLHYCTLRTMAVSIESVRNDWKLIMLQEQCEIRFQTLGYTATANWVQDDYSRCSLPVRNLQTFSSHLLSLCSMSDLQKMGGVSLESLNPKLCAHSNYS